jgi:hypothetical protein
MLWKYNCANAYSTYRLGHTACERLYFIKLLNLNFPACIKHVTKMELKVIMYDHSVFTIFTTEVTLLSLVNHSACVYNLDHWTTAEKKKQSEYNPCMLRIRVVLRDRRTPELRVSFPRDSFTGLRILQNRMWQCEFTFQSSTEKQQPQYFIPSYSNPLLPCLFYVTTTPHTTAPYTMD